MMNCAAAGTPSASTAPYSPPSQGLRPGDALRIEGELVGLTPSKTRPQGTVLIKWTLYNQRDEAVYTFTPIGIVPRQPG